MSESAPIASARPRDMVRVSGRVVAVQVEPSDAPPAFTVRVEDETGRIDAVFMGRRDVPGITPGTLLTLEGRVCEAGALPRLYNPRYELLSPS